MGEAITLGVSGWRLHGQRTGVGRYVLNLIEHWTPAVVANRFDKVTVYTPQQLDESEMTLPGSVESRVLGSSMPMIPWENVKLAPAARDSVMLYPSYSRPMYSHGATVVVTHDATMRLHPELFPKRDKLIHGSLYGWSARLSTLVITTTEAARGDIAREWGIDPAKIRVTHLAAADCFVPLSPTVDRDAMRMRLTGGLEPFFLFVGKISGRRNLPRLLEAFAEFKARTGFPHRLVMVGPRDAIVAIEKLAEELNVRASLMTKTFVDDKELNELYNSADAFVMPSTYETVSFPVMEAQAAGTPVICIDTPGSREMTGGDALLIPSLDVRDLVAAMTSVAVEPGFRSELGKRGLRNSRRFSWERCAIETLDICLDAARMHRNRSPR